MPDIIALTPNAALGPVYIKKKEIRDKYSHALTETCSLTDRVYQDPSSQLKVRFATYVHKNLEKVDSVPNTSEVIDDYQDMMQEHVERRILFFFQQLIVCYKTKLHFESVGASDQAISAEAIAINLNGHIQPLVTRQAAHSSTIPRLIAYDSAEWQQYLDDEIDKPTGFVFLKGTDYYRNMNATMNMPRWMNDADREIDEKTKFSKLREKGEALVNRASNGDISPDEGILEFLKEALTEVRSAKKRPTQGEVRQVLSYYETYLLLFRDEIQNDPTFLTNFLNLKFVDSPDEKSKRVMMQIRYAAIRNVQVDQSALIQKIEAVKKEVIQAIGKGTHFDAAFRTLLIEQAHTQEDRFRLEKLFNFSPSHFVAQHRKADISKYEKTKQAIAATYNKKIAFLVQELLQDMRHLRTKEAYQRAAITRELRGMKGWTQVQLGKEVKKIFPHAAASQPTISRIENRVKLVTSQIAQELSRVLRVDSGLFMPHFFYD